MRNLDGRGPERLFGILKALGEGKKTAAGKRVPIADIGLLAGIRRIREAQDKWQQRKHKRRRDTFDAQLHLSRVAAGLNWANKPISQPLKVLAIGYAGWASKEFAAQFLKKNGIRILSNTSSEKVANNIDDRMIERHVLSADEKQQAVAQLWDEVEHFDESRAKYVLLAGKLRDADMASIGLIPWTAVIDLDPTSDEAGLLGKAFPLLSKSRLVRQITRRNLEARDFRVEAAREAVWFMAGGWPSRQEPMPNIDEWRRSYIPLIRRLCEVIRDSVAPQSVKIVVLASEGLAEVRLPLLLAALDEVFRTPDHVILLGASSSLAGVQLPLSVATFIQAVRSLFGTQDAAQDPEIPGNSGPVTVSNERLRDLEVDFDVLHSRTLNNTAAQPRDRDAFWRGTQPTWTDLQAGLDVIRPQHRGLLEHITQALNEGGTHTIELQHMPGAGGSTVALRIAWTLRLRTPVVVLRSYTEHTAARIDQIFQLSQLPILVVADASLLPETSRHDLFRGLRALHVRSVILYVLRTMRSSQRPFSINDPMSLEDAEAFKNVYSARAVDAKRRTFLSEIARRPDLDQYRSPFFFGLVTYEREFTKIRDFTDTHLEHASEVSHTAIKFLALITRFSQAAMDEAAFRLVQDEVATGAATLDDILGPASRLIITQSRGLRIMHPLLAEEVLRFGIVGSKDAWRASIKNLCLQFIKTMSAKVGAHSRHVRELFVHLFIRREEWSRAGSGKFSELLNVIETPAGRHEVLIALTEACPDEAHFWNHLGRHQIYEMRSNYELAEEYLQTAVSLSPDDSVHHHALGMVRRLWIERQLDDMMQIRHEMLTADNIIEMVEDLAERASEAFARARQLRFGDEHGFVTEVQMIAEIGERLMAAASKAGAKSPSEISGRAGKWLQRKLAKASELLEKVRDLRPEPDAEPGQYILQCEQKLQGLFGTLSSLIASWENVLSHGNDSPELRRALATVYYRRSKRVWGALTESELRRIYELSEANLERDPESDGDMRMWFQAYRRLPEFSYVKALDRLGTWAVHTGAIDAYYYLYVLHYIMYSRREEHDEEQIKSNLDKMRFIPALRRDYSYEWMGSGETVCPLVHHRDLGQWHPRSGLPNARLERVIGTIDEIRGPQTGYIRIGRQIRAYFVPGAKFSPTSDINKVVNFYLGFSYDGFRAWMTEFGVEPGGTTSQENGGTD